MANVGFQFQGDVFHGASVIFGAAGRLMKQLSDGGVDLYALSAVVHLGRQMQISQQQEAVVTSCMEMRSREWSSWLNRALRIGWGLNDAAYELSRTSGGCAALLTLNAFAAGTTPMIAAQGLQELLRLRGCGTELLPSVDALRGVINGLNPVMEGSGFRTVLNAINLAAVKRLGGSLPGYTFEQEKQALMQDSESVAEWTDAAHQLCMTAAQGETIYIHARSRAAWLAAFATRMLEMGCTITYHDQVLWQAAGRNGTVAIQIAFDGPHTRPGFTSNLVLDPPHQIMQTISEMESTHKLGEAIDNELQIIPRLSDLTKDGIKLGIVQLIAFLSTRKCFSTSGEMTTVTGPFLSIHGRIVAVCEALGLRIPDLAEEVTRTVASTGRGFNLPLVRGWEVSILTDAEREEIRNVCYCDLHTTLEEARGFDTTCLWQSVSHLIAGFASAGLALIPCHLETTDLDVSARIINGTAAGIPWTDRCIDHLTKPTEKVDFQMLLNYLRSLFHGEGVKSLRPSAIGASGRGVTIAVRALLETDGFNIDGQYLGIYSGRLYHNGCIREVVEESERWVGGGQNHAQVMPATLAPGIMFTPPHSELFNNFEVRCQVNVRANHFEIHCDLAPRRPSDSARAAPIAPPPSSSSTSVENDTEEEIYFTVKLGDAVSSLLSAHAGQICHHGPHVPYAVPAASHFFTSVEMGIFCANPSDRACVLVSSHGDRTSQMLSMCAIKGSHNSFISGAPECLLVIQEQSCLGCAVELARIRIQRGGAGRYRAAAVICNGFSSQSRLSTTYAVPVRRPRRAEDIIGRFHMDEAAQANIARSQRQREAPPPWSGVPAQSSEQWRARGAR